MVKPVHPKDPQDVAEVIRIALSDDELAGRPGSGSECRCGPEPPVRRDPSGSHHLL